VTESPVGYRQGNFVIREIGAAKVRVPSSPSGGWYFEAHRFHAN
jgi:hypothetical protein